MPLTAAEQQELQQIRAALGVKASQPAAASGGLSLQERDELQQIRRELGVDKKVYASDRVTPEMEANNGNVGGDNIGGDTRLATGTLDAIRRIASNPNSMSNIKGVAEPIATFASSIVAEPAAGLAGIAGTLLPGDEGQGARYVEEARNALTYKPRTKEGQEAIAEIADFLKPVGKVIHDAEKFLGDKVFEATNSPTLAAAATTLPTAFIELLGVKGGGKVAKAGAKPMSARKARAILKEAAPDGETLKGISRGVYKELDNAGVTLKPMVYGGMIKKIEKAAKGQGLSARTTPKAMGVLDDMKDIAGRPVTLTEVYDLRKVAQNVAKNIDPTEAGLGSRMVNEIDDFLDGMSPKALNTGSIAAAEIGKKHKVARTLYGRAKKSETIQEAITKAGDTASGYENGLRIEFRKILNSRRKSKYFDAGELDAMRGLVKGDTTQNFAKLLGRFGFNEGNATNVVGAAIGGGAGYAAFGPAGTLAVPVAGTVARKVASRLTAGKAEFVGALTRSGKDGEKIVKAYYAAVPKAQRSVKELTDILSDPAMDLSGLFTKADKNLREIAEIAAGKQVIGNVAGAAAATGVLPKGQEDPLAKVSQESINMLLKDPSMAADFNEVYGKPGLAEKILKENK